MSYYPKNTLARQVRELRRKAGWTQKELAAKCGMTQGWISHIETGKRERLSLKHAKKLAAAFGVPVDYFAEDMDQAQASAALAEFLESSFAADVTEAQRNALRGMVIPWQVDGTPTAEMWYHIWKAMCAIRTYGTD